VSGLTLRGRRKEEESEQTLSLSASPSQTLPHPLSPLTGIEEGAAKPNDEEFFRLKYFGHQAYHMWHPLQGTRTHFLAKRQEKCVQDPPFRRTHHI